MWKAARRGTNGIPADAKAVSLNVTVVAGTTTSYLTVWPSGDPRPLASNLNWTGPDARPNTVTVGLGTDGKVSFYNDTGTSLERFLQSWSRCPTPSRPWLRTTTSWGTCWLP